MLGAEKDFDTDDQGGFSSKLNIVSGGSPVPFGFPRGCALSRFCTF